jgi:hypothetical protein
MHILDQIAKRAEELGIGSGMLIVSGIRNWPRKIPKTAQAWWNWIRKSFMGIIPPLK